MTFLPIVEREMRVAARRRGTYGMRMKIAGGATLIFAACYFLNLTDSSISLTKSVFWGLSGLCMLYCLAAGRLMTADCLSREKREGTLGLLFLTDLRGHDVVLGKIAANSLDGFYGLLALFPILAIPLIAGGMTNGEFWRMVVVLINTFLFSLTIGIFVSAKSYDERKVMGANLAVMLCFTLLPPALAGMLETFVPGFAAEQKLFYTCPIFSFLQCADARYKIGPGDFWWSIGLIFCLTLLLTLLACHYAPRSWQDKAPTSRKPGEKAAPRQSWWSERRARKAAAFRQRLLDKNAYLWLAARPYIRSTRVWVGLLLIAGLWIFTAISLRNVEEESNIVFGILLNAMLKLWITTEAARQLATDKKSGAFELLLSTPITTDDIVRGQRMALRRQFLKPVMVAMIIGLVFAFSIRPKEDAVMIRWIWMAGIGMLWLDSIVLGYFGMAAALRAKSHGMATIVTASVILVCPWSLFFLVLPASYLWQFLFFAHPHEFHWPYVFGCWLGGALLIDIYFGLSARRRLHNDFRTLALEPWKPHRWAWIRDLWAATAERKIQLRRKYRRAGLGMAIAVAAFATAILYDLYLARTTTPKPVIVTLSQSNTPVRIYHAQNSFAFILPDGTLWRWGYEEGNEASAVRVPLQLGTNRDWRQVSWWGNDALSLRSDGSMWTGSLNQGVLKPFGTNHDWVEICAGGGFQLARKADGSLWAWGNNNQNQLGIGPGPNQTNAVQVGTNRNWASATTFSQAVLGLQSNGTLWIWGPVNWGQNGAWNSTNYPVPTQFCRESDWVGMSGHVVNGVRNKSGQVWSFAEMLPATPGPNKPAAALGQMVNSNASRTAYGPLYTNKWTYARYELRTNGTLWAAPSPKWEWYYPGTPPAPEPPRQFGQRNDWVSINGTDTTMVGLTADGTLWTWGFDFGQESHWVQVAASRIEIAETILAGAFGRQNPSTYAYDTDFEHSPAQTEPRPLMKLISKP